MRWALAALWLSLPAVAEPSASLLPKDAPPAAIDFTQHKAFVIGLVGGAVLTAVALVVLFVVLTPRRFVTVDGLQASCSPVAGTAMCTNGSSQR